MKEFLINLLVLLLTPIYILAAIFLGILMLGLRFGESGGEVLEKAINFMKSDYEKIFKQIKTYFMKKQGG